MNKCFNYGLCYYLKSIVLEYGIGSKLTRIVKNAIMLAVVSTSRPVNINISNAEGFTCCFYFD